MNSLYNNLIYHLKPLYHQPAHNSLIRSLFLLPAARTAYQRQHDDAVYIYIHTRIYGENSIPERSLEPRLQPTPLPLARPRRTYQFRGPRRQYRERHTHTHGRVKTGRLGDSIVPAMCEYRRAYSKHLLARSLLLALGQHTKPPDLFRTYARCRSAARGWVLIVKVYIRHYVGELEVSFSANS